MVAIGSENDAFVDELESALKHPKFQLYLGRRSNAPAGILKTHIIADKNPVDALREIEWQAAKWYQTDNNHETISIELIADAKLLSGSRSYVIKDQVISFDQRGRRYGFRSEARTNVELKNHMYQEHDPLSYL